MALKKLSGWSHLFKPRHDFRNALAAFETQKTLESALALGPEINLASAQNSSGNRKEVSDKTQSIIVKNQDLLKATEIYGLVMKANSGSSNGRSEKWSVMVMHDQLIAFYSHSKGRKVLFGRQFDGTPLRLEGYEYDQQKNRFAPISLPGGWDSSFIDYVAAGKGFKGHVNWPGDSRKDIELVSANSITDIQKNNSFKINISEVSDPIEVLKLVNSRLRKLKRYRQQVIDLTNYLKSKGITDLPAGEDITPLIGALEELKAQLEALSNEASEPSEMLASKGPTSDSKAKKAEALRLAKLEEERKAKEAEALRLAKLEEERKARKLGRPRRGAQSQGS